LILLDSNVLSALMLRNPDPVIERWLNGLQRSAVWTTAVTLFEIQWGIELLPESRRRSELQLSFDRFKSGLLDRRIAGFDTQAAQHAAVLAAERRKAGRMIDDRNTMIAGIALANRATLATRNTRHFSDLSVQVINPWADGVI
jgi:predicted nucleic acid-binding protein